MEHAAAEHGATGTPDLVTAGPSRSRKQVHLPEETCESDSVCAEPLPSRPLERHVQGGAALIISNTHFDENVFGKVCATRVGAESERKKLTSLIRSFGFEVTKVNNKRYDDILIEVSNFAAEAGRRGAEAPATFCTLVVVLTHGEAGGLLYAKDGKMFNLKQVWGPLVSCPQLQGTPKIFMFQACRGRKSDVGRTVYGAYTDSSTKTQNSEDQSLATSDASIVPPGKEISISDIDIHLPNAPDVLLVFSSPEEQRSWLDPQAGTYFVQALSEAAEAATARPLDLVALLTRANRLLAARTVTSLEGGTAGNVVTYKQTVTFTSYLHYKLYLKRSVLQKDKRCKLQ